MSDATDAAGDNGRHGANLIFGYDASAVAALLAMVENAVRRKARNGQRRRDEKLSSPLVTTKEKEISDDLSYQRSFHTLY